MLLLRTEMLAVIEQLEKMPRGVLEATLYVGFSEEMRTVKIAWDPDYSQHCLVIPEIQPLSRSMIANHTGTQPVGTIDGITGAISNQWPAAAATRGGGEAVMDSEPFEPVQ